MPSLSIKNVPEEVVEKLRERARGHHRSLQGELMAILEEAVQPKRLTVQEAYQKVQESGLRTGDDSTQWIREWRDAG
jgi:plasmid stability protein